jgi:hypothetical protein
VGHVVRHAGGMQLRMGKSEKEHEIYASSRLGRHVKLVFSALPTCRDLGWSLRTPTHLSSYFALVCYTALRPPNCTEPLYGRHRRHAPKPDTVRPPSPAPASAAVRWGVDAPRGDAPWSQVISAHVYQAALLAAKGLAGRAESGG